MIGSLTLVLLRIGIEHLDPHSWLWGDSTSIDDNNAWWNDIRRPSS